MLNKKGQMVSGIIMAVLAVIIVAYLAIPQIQESGSFSSSESITKVNATANETFNLTHFPLLTVSIAGLTEGTNFSIVNADAGRIMLFNNTLNTTYTASYTYEGSRYIDSATDRTLFFVLITIFLVGLLYKIAEVFGLV